MNNLKWLEQWYTANCNGDWEHQYGIKLDTLDNPGWTIVIDLKGTRYEGLITEPLKELRTDDDWIHCIVDGMRFDGAGGSGNLDELLSAFRAIIGRHDQVSLGSSSLV